MTIDEAIQEIINLANNLQIIQSTPTGQAITMALKALKICEEIPKEEVTELAKARDKNTELNRANNFHMNYEIAYQSGIISGIICATDIMYKHLSELGVKDVRNME